MYQSKEFTHTSHPQPHIPKGMCGDCGTVGRLGLYASPQPQHRHRALIVATVAIVGVHQHSFLPTKEGVTL